MSIDTIIITRHAALAQYLIDSGIVPVGTPIIPHAGESDIRGRRVVGPLPLHLAALAASIVHVPLDLPQELRGVELTIEQVRQYAGPAQEFCVFGAYETRRWDAEGNRTWGRYPNREAALVAASIDPLLSAHNPDGSCIVALSEVGS